MHAVAVAGGAVVAAAGEPRLLTFLRSSAKPVQALPLVRARPDLDDREIAIACASHLGGSEQIEAVRRLLAAAPAREDELETGPEPTPIGHNCSGKHAGFLALCRARVEDGAFRAIRPAVAAFLGSLGIETGSLGVVSVANSRGEPIGEVLCKS